MNASHIVAHLWGSQLKPPVLHHSFVVMNSLSDIYHNHLLILLRYKQVICQFLAEVSGQST